MDIDPDRLRAILGALAGASIYGLVQFGAVALGGHPVSREVYGRLAVNVVCATLAGVIMSGALIKVIAPLIPFEPLRDASAFGFAVGAFGWELLPLIFKAVGNRAKRQVQQLDAEVK